MPETPTPRSLRDVVGWLACRIVTPLWLLAGAVVKLIDRDPRLLPKPVFSVVQSLDGSFGLGTALWFDTAMRSMIAVELALVLIMFFMPRWARTAAIAVLSLFVAILVVEIVPLWSRDGLDKVLSGSCGCFGGWSPNPLLMLALDGALLLLVALLGRGRLGPARASAPSCSRWCTLNHPVCALAIGAGVAFGVPAKQTPAIAPPVNDISTQVAPPVDPPVQPIAATVWPGPPAQLEAYYIPDFAQWQDQPLAAQDLARLIEPAPVELLKGDWLLLFYRADCDVCHELMTAYLSGELPMRTLAVVIPDTDPALALEFPCQNCQTATLRKDLQYVVATPVLLRLHDGVVRCVAADGHDNAAIEACLAP